MTYDTALEQRIDAVIVRWAMDIPKKTMFGGVCYTIRGNIAFGIRQDELLVRASEAVGDALMAQSGMRHFVMGGRTSTKNWYLASHVLAADEARLEELLAIGRNYTLSLPVKT